MNIGSFIVSPFRANGSRRDLRGGVCRVSVCAVVGPRFSRSFDDVSHRAK